MQLTIILCNNRYDLKTKKIIYLIKNKQNFSASNTLCLAKELFYTYDFILRLKKTIALFTRICILYLKVYISVDGNKNNKSNIVKKAVNVHKPISAKIICIRRKWYEKCI